MNEPTRPASSIFSHGAAWVRADFHLHTKADKEFSYSAEPNEFFTQYVNALVQAQIRVGVIANHNKFEQDEFKELCRRAKKNEILLLPGVELSIKDGSNGIHTLVVFSPEWIDNQENKNYINTFLEITFANQANYENENGRSNHDLHETIRELDKFERDYFLICAHVEDRNGLWEELKGGRLRELARFKPFQERLLGFQKVRTRDRKRIVMQHMENCYPAEVEGCDCKSIEQIGRGQRTFLKIGALTFEAVKFALLDHANRVAPEPQHHAHSHLRSVRFEGAKLPGVELALSAGLNTLIGIRGSGKSSILESIRYALGIELPQRADVDEYKQGAVKYVLGSGGKITLIAVDRHQNEYEIRRIFGEQPEVFLNGTLQPGINLRETVLHKPIHFGQKDLSSTEQGFENELVEKLVGDSLLDIRRETAVSKHAVVETVRRLQKLADVGEKRLEYRNRQADAEHRLWVFRQHGVEDKLQKQVDFEQDSRALKGLIEFANSYIASLREFVAQYEDEFRSRRRYESKRNVDFFRDVTAIFDRVAKRHLSRQQVARNNSRVADERVRGWSGHLPRNE